MVYVEGVGWDRVNFKPYSGYQSLAASLHSHGWSCKEGIEDIHLVDCVIGLIMVGAAIFIASIEFQ